MLLIDGMWPVGLQPVGDILATKAGAGEEFRQHNENTVLFGFFSLGVEVGRLKFKGADGRG